MSTLVGLKTSNLQGLEERKKKVLVIQSCLFATSWTVAHQGPLSMEFSRQEYWSGFAIPFSRGSSRPRDRTHVSCIAGRFFTDWATREALLKYSLNTSCLWPFVLVLPAPLWGSSESGPFSPTLCHSQAAHLTDCSENYAFLCFLHLSCWWDPV